ncbi:hypothetical protein [Streptomyces griseoloalbus]|uniref:Lipoprotein n=1 Tax=Streptomyces griseoloalbus TaxID=67303 RepID=A0A7W8FC59_9ACTN|nr:hypothetical protein [Streptomyces albaduncus]MBB5128131.1 hypothetical protein [Streptomyces albaduncus]GGV66390.1 lipoprotein [Streptomyces griseoloalbus]GGW63458.1 lipoprotein [Streptomyces albaduncus]
MIPISQGRSRRATLAGAVCALLVTGTALTGCSEDPNEGTNGVGRLPADQIRGRAQKAAESVGTVRLHGTVVTSGRTYTLDMRLKEKGGIGSVTTKGETFRLLRIDDELYLKAGAEFWGQAGGEDGGENGGEGGGGADAAAAGKLAEKYVKVPQGDPSYKKFIGFTDKNVLLGGLLTLHGKLATDGHHQQAGVRTIRVTGDKGSGGTLDVSLEGTPYPVRLVRAGEAGTLTFSAWGTDFPLEKPAQDETLDYGQQLPSS